MRPNLWVKLLKKKNYLKMKCLATISNAFDTGLMTPAVINGSLSILVLISGWTLPAGVALSGITILMLMTTAASQRSAQFHFSPAEFARGDGKYSKLKEEIQRRSKAKVKEIKKKQKIELLEKGGNKDKEDFLQKIAITSGSQGANAI